MRRLRIALLLLALSALSTLVAAELTLQLLGLTKAWWAVRATPTAVGEPYTILCLGDSHTYGAPLPREESYPAQLQARLDADLPDRYRVVNLGAPGANTAMVARHFEENVRRHRPDLVILWVGVNNVWNPTDTERWDGAQRGWARRALDQSKLLKLARVLLNFRLQVRIDEAEAEAGARMDLAYMVEEARASGIPAVLITYPLDHHDYANAAIRSVGRDLEVDVIDSVRDLERAKRDGLAFEDLFVVAAGPHPRATLYRYVVESMLPVVLRYLPPPAADPARS